MSYPASHRVRPRLLIFMLSLISSLIAFSFEGAEGQDGNPPAATAEIVEAKEEQVRFTNGPTSLAGTLFWPAEKAECPAVVLLAGSDRSKRGPLRIAIARYFAAHEIAALVYDSPGTGSSSGNALLQSSDDRVTEALAAVAFLRKQKGIRSAAVGLFGGSEGANIALMTAAKDAGVAFVIPVSSAMGVSILDVMRYSAEKRGHQQKLTPDEIAKAITFKEIAFVLLSGVELAEWSLLESRVEQWEDDTWRALIDIAKPREKKLTQQEKQAFLISFKKIVTHFFTQRWFKAVDIGNAVQQLLSLDAATFFTLIKSGPYSRDWDRSLCFTEADIRCPVLAIWGQEDSFLPPNQSAARLRKYLVDSRHPDYEVVVFKDATHFLTVPGSKMDFVPGYLDKMVSWLGKRFGPDVRTDPPQTANPTQ